VKVKILSSTNPVLQLAFEEIAKRLDEKPDFALISISPLYPAQDVPYCIEKILGLERDKYLGFNAVDAFENTNIIATGVVACFLWFEGKGGVKLHYFPNIDKRLANKKFLNEVISVFSNHSSDLNIIIADYTHGLFPLFFGKISASLDKENINTSNICGGIISTKEKFPSYIFVAGKVLRNSFSIVSFENVKFEMGLSTGIFKRGPIYTITSGKGFFIYEFDNKPAGFLPKILLRGIEKGKKEYLWYTPLVIMNDEGELLALRTFKDFTDRYVEVWAPIEKGQKVKLAIVIPDEILRDTEMVAQSVKEKIGFTELVLNFSCIARQYTLEDRAQEEVEIYGKKLNAPIFGFFTCGEIALGIHGKKLKLHNQTSVVVALREERKNEG
jgi:small ligand-binding sensory domain FIST